MTVCAHHRQCSFGRLAEDRVELSPAGVVVGESWEWLSKRYRHVELDQYVVMPNHIHGIIVIHELEEGDSRVAPTPCEGAVSKAPTLGRLINAFKTVSAKRVNQLLSSSGKAVWQRGYYDRVIRSERELADIRRYMANNPKQWQLDRENPSATERLY